MADQQSSQSKSASTQLQITETSEDIKRGLDSDSSHLTEAPKQTLPLHVRFTQTAETNSGDRLPVASELIEAVEVGGPDQALRDGLCACPQTQDGSAGRNLVVCIDGTSNQFGNKNTNVIELYSHVIKSDSQLTYYDSGIGTYARPSSRPSFSHLKRFLDNKIDLAIAWNLEKVILGAYRWLSDKFKEGDRIFFFGFSRGAYQIRALAGMIEKVGLILPGNEAQIPFAYELYADCHRESTNRMAHKFKETFSRPNVRVHFIGAWDTVSSVGLIRDKTLPLVTGSCNHICLFRHALALDERRVKFQPEFVNGGRSYEVIHETNKRRPHIKEVWFAGSHSDIGGGNRFNVELQLGDIPLLWMRNEAMIAGLHLRPGGLVWKAEDIKKTPSRSLNMFYWFLELLPISRLTYNHSSRITSRPNLGRGRVIVSGQKIHASVLFKEQYKPIAGFASNFNGRLPVLAEPLRWTDPQSHSYVAALDGPWEKDLFDDSTASVILARELDRNKTSEFVQLAELLAFSPHGRDVILEVPGALGALTKLLISPDPKIQISAAIALSKFGSDKAYLKDDIKSHCIAPFAVLLGSDNDILQRQVLSALPILAESDDLRRNIIAEEIPATLIRLTNSSKLDVQASALRAMSHLINFADILEIIIASQASITPVITAILREEYESPMLLRCAKILTSLVHHDEKTRGNIREMRLIQHILARLKHTDYQQPYLVQALAMITTAHEELDHDYRLEMPRRPARPPRTTRVVNIPDYSEPIMRNTSISASARLEEISPGSFHNPRSIFRIPHPKQLWIYSLFRRH